MEAEEEEEEEGLTTSDEEEEGDLDTLLYEACSAGDDASVRTLLEHGAAPNSSHARDGTTALHFAAWNGHRSTMRLLMAWHATIDTPERRGCTPLHLASLAGHCASARILLEGGANPNSRCALGMSPHQIAVENGFAHVGELLASYGADVYEPPALTHRHPSMGSGGLTGEELGEDFLRQAATMPLPLRRLDSPES